MLFCFIEPLDAHDTMAVSDNLGSAPSVGDDMADLPSAIEQLNTSWTTTLQRWHATHVIWRDTVGLAFYLQHVQPLEQQVPPTLQEMANLSQVIAGARRHVH